MIGIVELEYELWTLVLRSFLAFSFHSIIASSLLTIRCKAKQTEWAECDSFSIVVAERPRNESIMLKITQNEIGMLHMWLDNCCLQSTVLQSFNRKSVAIFAKCKVQTVKDLLLMVQFVCLLKWQRRKIRLIECSVFLLIGKKKEREKDLIADVDLGP